MSHLRLSVCVLAISVPVVGFAADAAPSAMRQKGYTHRSREEALAWQKGVRSDLFRLLKMDDLVGRGPSFDEKTLRSEARDGYTLREVEINATSGRRIRVLVAVPSSVKAPCPAVVCIHGHGGNRSVVYDTKTIYKGFAHVLATRGVVTIATDVGQHKVYESGRTLMGERLWDVMRCVDYVASMPQVDRSKIGCAGLSLGGEMAMWLGAMDDRVGATVSAGFLTMMDQMEKNHCMCWKFPGLRERVDFPDIYSLIAPRALQCQNGRKEPPTQFNVPLAEKAMAQVKVIYQDFSAPDAVELDVHDGEHEIDLPGLLRFFEKRFLHPSP